MKENKTTVTVREKEIKNGVKSLYLDIYHNGSRKYEFLNIHLNPNEPTSNLIKRAQATAIKNERLNELTQTGIRNKSITTFIGCLQSLRDEIHNQIGVTPTIEMLSGLLFRNDWNPIKASVNNQLKYRVSDAVAKAVVLEIKKRMAFIESNSLEKAKQSWNTMDIKFSLIDFCQIEGNTVRISHPEDFMQYLKGQPLERLKHFAKEMEKYLLAEKRYFQTLSNADLDKRNEQEAIVWQLIKENK